MALQDPSITTDDSAPPRAPRVYPRNTDLQTQQRTPKRQKKWQRLAAMATQAFNRRLKRLGMTSLIWCPIRSDTEVLYLDAGLHRKAEQLRLVREWFSNQCRLRMIGFEAHPDYLDSARKAIGSDKDVTLVHVAVVGPGQGSTVSLHHDGRTGVGDSLLRQTSHQTIEVPATRLSSFLQSLGVDLDRTVLILRMNIEGAETLVLEDLLEANLIDRFDGFYGAWDDPMKIGGEVASKFRKLRDAAGVENFRFNDKDCRSNLAQRIIRYDLRTSIVAGARSKAANRR